MGCPVLKPGEDFSILEKTNHYQKGLFARGLFLDHLSTIITKRRVLIFFASCIYFYTIIGCDDRKTLYKYPLKYNDGDSSFWNLKICYSKQDTMVLKSFSPQRISCKNHVNPTRIRTISHNGEPSLTSQRKPHFECRIVSEDVNSCQRNGGSIF